MDFKNLSDGYVGFCGISEFNENKSRPKDFSITLHSRCCKKTRLIALAHEMIHLKQYAKGELYEYESDATKWKGKIITPTLMYWDHPWEIEAYGRQLSLYNKFIIYQKSFDNPAT
jgi:hypothetical protein